LESYNLIFAIYQILEPRVKTEDSVVVISI